MQVKVSIIIVNYNTLNLVIQCIKSIIKHTRKITYEIIIIDNNSKDDLSILNTIQEFKYIPLIYHKLQNNIGFGGANNEGLKFAKGEYIFFLNPDTVILNDAISILANYLDLHPECGACGGNLFNTEMCPTRSFRRRFFDNLWLLDTIFTNNTFEKLLYRKNIAFNTTNVPLDVSYIVGADLMIRHSIIKKIQGFDKDFFMYYEEIELCYRTIKSGAKIRSIPWAQIQHLEGKSSSNIDFKAHQMYRSSRLYFMKTQNRLSFIISRVLYFILSLQRYALNLFINNKAKREYWQIQLQNFFKFL